MNQEHLKFLRCPKTNKKLIIEEPQIENDRIKSGILVEPISGNRYPVVNFIPRFVPSDNYANNFGFEWNLHSDTQYDSYSLLGVSKKRFEEETKWPKDLKGEVILEVGSGSGRFTTIAAESSALIISIDYSNAVEANYKSNGSKDNVFIIQASVYEMPFEKKSFDRAFCFGVLQHTPNPKNSFFEILKFVKPGGAIASDIYLWSFTRRYLNIGFYIRPLVRNANPEKLYAVSKKYIDIMWPLARVLRKIPVIGWRLNWKLMIADHSTMLPDADDKTLKEWAYLDTFDFLSPRYDLPETVKGFRKWHEEAGLKNIEVHKGYNGVEGRGVVP
ncbi:MAG: class I SAM-dependent methyltransferase [Ignavibacteriales bacterium]|nr:MAG: class I SAM-dependent methyltransferase [Ignavibacteriales bacterium]